MNYTYFFLAIAFLLVHEMDAIHKHEWRMFPLTYWLPEAWGYRVFTLLHIPLYVGLFFAIVQLPSPSARNIIYWLDVFCIIHVLLHLLFLMHKKNEFKGFISWLLIAGAGFFGLIDIILNDWK